MNPEKTKNKISLFIGLIGLHVQFENVEFNPEQEIGARSETFSFKAGLSRRKWDRCTVFSKLIVKTSHK